MCLLFCWSVNICIDLQYSILCKQINSKSISFMYYHSMHKLPNIFTIRMTSQESDMFGIRERQSLEGTQMYLTYELLWGMDCYVQSCTVHWTVHCGLCVWPSHLLEELHWQVFDFRTPAHLTEQSDTTVRA